MWKIKTEILFKKKKKGTRSKHNNQNIKEFLLYVNMFIYSVEIVVADCTTQLCTV